MEELFLDTIDRTFETTCYPSGSSFTFHCFLARYELFLTLVLFVVWRGFCWGHCALRMTVVVQSAGEHLQTSLSSLWPIFGKAGTRQFWPWVLLTTLGTCQRKVGLAYFCQDYGYTSYTPERCTCLWNVGCDSATGYVFPVINHFKGLSPMAVGE